MTSDECIIKGRYETSYNSEKQNKFILDTRSLLEMYAVDKSIRF